MFRPRSGSPVLGLLYLILAGAAPAARGEWFLADGQAWPGKIAIERSGRLEDAHVRPEALTDDDVPRVQSVDISPSGALYFCSGLDRSVFELLAGGESRVHRGGGLVRQVRTDADGTLYWSGLETPIDRNPLPDGFIYRWDAARRGPETVLTFSQGDVGNDWWGAFAVREGRIYIGTLRGRTRIYDVTESPVRLVCELPFSAPAFRFGDDNALYACDGAGKLYRFPNRDNMNEHEVVLETTLPFVDFVGR